MSIRSKLLILIASNLVMFSLAITAYFLILDSRLQIEAERQAITELNETFGTLMAANNRVALMPLRIAKANFENAASTTVKAFDNLNSITHLPSINLEVKQAIEGIIGLRELNDSAIAVMFLSIDTVSKDSQELFGDTPDITAFRMFSLATSADASSELLASKFRIGHMMQSIMRFNTIIDKNIELLAKQFSIIQLEIDGVYQQSNILLAILVFLVMVITLVAASLVSLTITKDFRKNGTLVKQIATGDFTLSFNTKRKDEFAKLGEDLNSLICNLNHSLVSIQAASHANREAKDALLVSVESATASSTEIEANTTMIRERMIELDKRVGQNSLEVHDISTSIIEFQRLLSLQNNHVSHSVHQVTELITVIKTVNAHAELEKKAADSLVKVSNQSKLVIDGTFEALAGITDSISSIRDIANVIANIAAQTNLLAMNAAIEAAHAGQFGHGFAVVASEIGKLASASALSSKEISQNLKNVITKIQGAANTRQQSDEAIQTISTQVAHVYTSSETIFEAVSTMEHSSKEIMAAMTDLKETSTKVDTHFTAIHQGTNRIQDSVGDLERISNEVVSNIGEISQGLQEISDSIRAVSSATENLESISNNLETSTGRFKTKPLEKAKRSHHEL